MPHFMTDEEIRAYQTRHTWQPGELVEVWNYDLNRSEYGIVVSDTSQSVISSTSKGGGLQQIEIRKICVMSSKGITIVDKWSIYPVAL